MEKNLNPSFKSGRTVVGVWSCFCRDEMGPLVIIEKGGTMTAKQYLETVKKHFLPFYCCYGPVTALAWHGYSRHPDNYSY